MNPHITIVTLGVEDLQRAINFYQKGLGFPSEYICSNTKRVCGFASR